MKAVMIIYNEALTEKVDYMLTVLGIDGYTMWEGVKGRGSRGGVPHLQTHTWPEVNSTMMLFVEDSLVDPILEKVKKIDSVNEEVGIRAFSWDVEKSV